MPGSVARMFQKVGDIMKSEPVAFQGLVQSGLALLAGFGIITMTSEQTGLTLALTAAILTLVARRQVTPNARTGPSGPAGPVSGDRATTAQPVN